MIVQHHFSDDPEYGIPENTAPVFWGTESTVTIHIRNIMHSKDLQKFSMYLLRILKELYNDGCIISANSWLNNITLTYKSIIDFFIPSKDFLKSHYLVDVEDDEDKLDFVFNNRYKLTDFIKFNKEHPVRFS